MKTLDMCCKVFQNKFSIVNLSVTNILDAKTLKKKTIPKYFKNDISETYNEHQEQFVC